MTPYGADAAPPAADAPGGIRRKTLLKAALVAAPMPILIGAVPAIAREISPSGETFLEPTPFCDDGDDPTIAQTEGPYFKPNSPRRASIVDGPGTALTVTGTVYGRNCVPIANVLLDFWQADNNGAYDNTTFRFRGHQLTNAQGQYTLTTIVPGLYPGRTRHIHVKVQAPGRPILTTQLYFPGEPRNSTDTIYDARLLMTMSTQGSGRVGRYDFVLNYNPPSPTVAPTTTRPPTTQPPTTQPPTTRPPTSNPPTTRPPTSSPGGTWAAYTYYAVGATVTYNGVTYRCIQAHTAYPGWEPPNVPALWARV